MYFYVRKQWQAKKCQLRTVFFSLSGLLLVSNMVQAVPMMTTYQGHLADANGHPLNTTVNMMFALYDAPTGGTLVWSETHSGVTITQGVFSVVLGSDEPFEQEDFEGERYLGMTVGDDPEMMPREQLTSVAFAIKAGIAESVVDSAVGTDKLAENAVTTDKVVDDAVTGAKIADLSGHSATELDDISSAGSGAIITGEERNRWNGLGSGAFKLNGNDAYYTDGNVGIGTTSPSAKLDVNGQILMQGFDAVIKSKDTVDGLNRTFHLIGTYHGWDKEAIYVGGYNYYRPAGNVERSYAKRVHFGAQQTMTVDFGSGKVGIGTTNPIRNLHLQSPSISSEIVMEVSNYEANKRKWNIVVDGQTSHSPNQPSKMYFRQLNDAGTGGVIPLIMYSNGNVVMNGNLDVVGTIRGNNVSPSDQRLKQNIQPLENSLAKVDQLRGVSFEWKDAKQDTGTQIGVIAQEVETVLPEIVSTDSDGYKSVAYGKLTAVLVEAVKELKAENAELRTQTMALKAIICEDHPEKAICQ